MSARLQYSGYRPEPLPVHMHATRIMRVPLNDAAVHAGCMRYAAVHGVGVHAGVLASGISRNAGS
jgi:hypothetical protein